MGSPSRNVQYHPPRLSEDRLNLPQPHSPSLPTHCSGKSGMRPGSMRTRSHGRARRPVSACGSPSCRMASRQWRRTSTPATTSAHWKHRSWRRRRSAIRLWRPLGIGRCDRCRGCGRAGSPSEVSLSWTVRMVVRCAWLPSISPHASRRAARCPTARRDWRRRRTLSWRLTGARVTPYWPVLKPPGLTCRASPIWRARSRTCCRKPISRRCPVRFPTARNWL